MIDGTIDARMAVQAIEVMRALTVAAHEFEHAYLERSRIHYPNLTLDGLRAHSRVVPCSCDSPDCEGWGMVPLDSDTCGVCGDYEWRHDARRTGWQGTLADHDFTRDRYWPLP